MDPQARGRSPSQGTASHLRHNPSASPHPPLDPSFHTASANANHFQDDSFAGLNPSAASGSFADPSFTQDPYQQTAYSLDPIYSNYQGQQAPAQSNDITNHTFLQSAHGANLDFNSYNAGSNHVSPGALSQNTSPTGPTSADTSSFPSFDFNQVGFDQNSSLDPTLLGDVNVIPDQLDLFQPQPTHLNTGPLDPMATTTMQSQNAPTPPHLLGCHHSGSPSPSASPSFQQAQFGTVNRPRNTSESLDPSSAAFPQGEWGNMGAYRGHRRLPSDQLSDISSQHNSPYMGTMDNFDNGHSSPMLNASNDPAFNDGLGLGQFSLSDNASQHSFHSPGHSPHISPRLLPQQSLPAYTQDDGFGMNAMNGMNGLNGINGMNGQFQSHNGIDMFSNSGVPQEPFPSLGQGNSPGDFGAADQMSPPEINIHLAPNAKHEAPMKLEEDTLSPPPRSPSRNRIRAKSDSHLGSRPTTPSGVRGRSPSLQTQTSVDGSLAPFDDRTTSRSSSPARGRNGSIGSRNGRSSSNASDHREYILDLANPERTPSNDPNNRRQQKHPATFQCTLCPKRFTRAYNLRSHLRTHTDERPFVCTVCGKAFARQHDRKRHEGLHSGEKKFVCRGNLSSGSSWGCGRRFARADALGRHFRSEAGRVCIKPLLDEEAAERQKVWMEEQQQQQMAAGMMPQAMMPMDVMGGYIPQAILQQYPALAGLDWNAMPQGNPPDEEVYAGRSSFDDTSGGEFYGEDVSENEMGAFPPPGALMGQQQPHYGMPQQQQQQQGYASNRAGDYLTGFEGR